ncbi:hypothetical protein N5J44_09865 [Acinetobacter ursingii]|uniref:hypothetical protein n=1 Tax=Acinetobacter ursingii TaxID=108980 RepID=UPI00244D2093|nr:hypothetical protein [Acinetobacter ursingii]MDH2019418.1 hypothetical protein [Acinetobacter ursingii]MDH2071844.1 hypothetical protein [Acinetobacter ursingii]
MSEQETYGVRVEKKIDQVQAELKALSENQVRQSEQLAVILNQGKDNAREIDRLDEKVRFLENKSSGLDGGLNVVRWISGALTGALIGMAGWLGSSIIDLKQETSIHTSKLTRIDTDANAANARLSQIERDVKK